MTRLSTRRNRRVYITLYTLALVFLYPSLYENLGVFAFLVFLLLSPLYYSGSTIVAAYRKDRMDERERQMVLEGMTTAYAIFVGTLLASLVVATFEIPEWLAGLAPYLLLTQSVLFDFWSLYLLAVVLPVCVVAWLEPDPPTEEARVMSAG